MAELAYQAQKSWEEPKTQRRPHPRITPSSSKPSPKLEEEPDWDRLYPATTDDDENMAQSAIHSWTTKQGSQTLDAGSNGVLGFFVADNMNVYYRDRQGQVAAPIAPDLMVIKNVDRAKIHGGRVSFVLEREIGCVLSAAIEVFSDETHVRDRDEKPAIYEYLSFRELFLFDPRIMRDARLRGQRLRDFDEQERNRQRVWGYRLIRGQYQEIPLVDGRIASQELELELGAALLPPPDEGFRLRFFDPAEGQWLLDTDEEFQEYRRQQRLARQQINRERQERERERRRAEEAERQVEEERRQAERRVEEERRRADDLQRQLDAVLKIQGSARPPGGELSE